MWWQKQGQRHWKMVPLTLKVEEGPRTEECRRRLEARKGKGVDSPQEPPERESGTANTLLLACETHLDFWSPQLYNNTLEVI